MSNLKPIKIFWRVLVILEELDLPYETSYVELDEFKRPPLTDVNPNGRIPAIIDPNTGLKLWESGAIIQYLIDTYDNDNKLTYTGFPEKYQLTQWSFFQASGQGPYFGQTAWFNIFHEKTYGETLESAKVRYGSEVKRVAGVLNTVLSEKEWLVGDKCTYADLAFVIRTDEHAWNPEEFPHFTRWQNAMVARPSVAKVISVLNDKEVKKDA
ncbi:glutathione S-transferase [Aspergillus bertholletiae]|uniref:Glutathione S-transferase n=1 Tax=Aspergillus bertholletiae TaxID=1226010 RepID=A0A5N7BIP0_9EURO|nr:glutathione S-transferase [Aspergillus bertholletiae]